MNPSTTPDPVNRWATEHYGFDDEPTSAHGPRPASGPTGQPGPSPSCGRGTRLVAGSHGGRAPDGSRG